jgi:hypothetical protein
MHSFLSERIRQTMESSKRVPLRHTVCNAGNVSKLSSSLSKTKSENTRLLQLEHGMNDVLRQLSNMQNQMKAMKLKVQSRDERIKLLEQKIDELRLEKEKK